MAELIAFNPYLSWVDITSPNEVPPEFRPIGAGDLLRYEQFGITATAKINEHSNALEQKLDKAFGESAITDLNRLTNEKLGKVEAAGIYATQESITSQLKGQVDPLVAQAIAADGTVAAAAEAAVSPRLDEEITLRSLISMATFETELDTRNIIEGTDIVSGEDISIAFGDEDGRRTWLEAAGDGSPTPFSSGLIVDRIGPEIAEGVRGDLGIEEMNSAVTELAFVVIDDDGRRTEVEIGVDGRFTQRVIDSIGSRLNITPPPDPTAFVLPSSIPVVVGRTYRLYYKDFISALDANATVVVSGTAGANVGDHWRFTPTAAGTLSLKLSVMDRVGGVVKDHTVPIVAYATTSGTGKRHLTMGDSISRAGNYALSAISSLAGAKLVGTRTYAGTTLNVEGRGGWSLANYFTQIGSNVAGDSPFLFPVGIAGAKFWGNTEFWRKVCYVPMNTLPSNGYDFDGFQKMARGWTADGPFQFNTTGYPVAPAEGDVVVDPTKAAGSTFQQYTGGAWVTMATQPAVEFSFTKYMQRYAAAFPEGGPTSISVMLETNDFYRGVNDGSFATWKSRLDSFIASVRAWSPTVPIIYLLAATGGPPQNWTNETVQKYDFDRAMRDAATRILAAYDTAAQRTNRVFVATFLGAISAANMSDHVHPAVPAGHDEMAPYLAGMLTKLTTEGL